jgi:hypothetical protein
MDHNIALIVLKQPWLLGILQFQETLRTPEKKKSIEELIKDRCHPPVRSVSSNMAGWEPPYKQWENHGTILESHGTHIRKFGKIWEIMGDIIAED